MSDNSKIKDTAEVVKGIVEAVPVYQDAIQPAVKEIGTALQTVAKTVHVMLAPVSALIWGYEQIREYVVTSVTEKLKDVPPEQITTPKPNVAGPAIEALRFTGHEESLRDLYANLLATSMDSKTASGALPAFVEIIKQLTPDEAKIVRLLSQHGQRAFPLLTVRWEFKNPTEEKRGGKDVLTNFSLLGCEAKCEFPDLTPTYIDNLCRLGLSYVPFFFEYTASGVYDDLENNTQVLEAKWKIEQNTDLVSTIQRKGLLVTELGKLFCSACVTSHDQIVK